MTASAHSNIALLEHAAVTLGELLDELVLVGGCAAGLLVTEPGASPIRSTEDVDLLVEATNYTDYHRFGKRLAERGFKPGAEPDDPLCRWRHGELILDIMPIDENILGFSNRWYRGAIRAPHRYRLPTGISLAHIDAPHFLATKLEAFRSRGRGDYLASADLEDVVAVIDGRASIERELATSGRDLQTFVAGELEALLSERGFAEALPGHFVGEGFDDRRVRSFVKRLQHIVGQNHG